MNLPSFLRLPGRRHADVTVMIHELVPETARHHPTRHKPYWNGQPRDGFRAYVRRRTILRRHGEPEIRFAAIR